MRAKQVACELNGGLIGAYWAYLVKGNDCCRETRRVLLGRLRELATDATPASAFDSLAAWTEYLEKKH